MTYPHAHGKDRCPTTSTTVPLDGGYGSPAKRRLDGYAEQIYKLIGVKGRRYHAHAAVGEEKLDHLGERVDSYEELVTGAVERAMQQ